MISSAAVFSVEQELYAHFLEQKLVFGRQVVLVIDSGDDLGGPQPLCEQGSDYVDFLGGEWVHGYEQVSHLHSGLLQGLDGSGVAHHRLHVGVEGEIVDTLLVGVYDQNLIPFHAKHLCQM